jgi:Polysaccharide lyase
MEGRPLRRRAEWGISLLRWAGYRVGRPAPAPGRAPVRASGPVKKLLALAIVAVVLGLAACSHETQRATNVTPTSATLHGDLTWNDKQRSMDWRWAWSGDGGRSWERTAWKDVPRCSNDTCSAQPTHHVTGLRPDSRYILRLAVRTTDGRVYYGDSNGLGSNDPPYEYDSFNTPPTANGYPSLAEIDYDGDFDPAGQLVGGRGGWQQNVVGTDYPGNATIVTNRVAEGNYAGKFTATGSGRSRAELAKFETRSNPEVTYEFLTYVPSSAPFIGSITQHKMGGDGGSCYNGGLSIREADLRPHLELVAVGDCDNGDETEIRYDLGTFPRDQWFATKVHEKFANNGSVRAWVDTDGPGRNGYVQRLPTTPEDTVGDPTVGVKFRMGLYGDPPQGTSVWADGFHLDCISRC